MLVDHRQKIGVFTLSSLSVAMRTRYLSQVSDGCPSAGTHQTLNINILYVLLTVMKEYLKG